MPPRLPISRPASWASLTSGRTPTAMMTRSVVIRLPSLSSTLVPWPSVTTSVTLVRRCRSTPCRFSSSCSGTAISGSTLPMTLASSSTSATARRRSISASAISKPMYPPPTTTAREQSSFSTTALIASMSGMDRRVKTRGESMPGILGRTGSAPGLRISTS